MKNKNDKNKITITDKDFVQRDEFHSYTAPVPTSAGRRHSRAAAKAAAEKRKRIQEDKIRQEQLKQAKIEAENRRMAQEREQRLAEQKADRQAKAEQDRLVSEEVERNRQIIKQKKMREQAELERARAMQQEQERLEQLEQFEQESLDTLSESRAKPRITLLSGQSDSVDSEKTEDTENDENVDNVIEEDDTPSFTYVNLGENQEENPEEESVEEEEPVRNIQQKSAADNAKVMDIRKARKKQKTKKFRTKIIVLSVLLAVGVGVFATNRYWVPVLEGILDKPHATIVNDGKTEAGNFPIELDDSAVSCIDDCGGYMVRLDDNHIVFYNENGQVENTFAHNYGSPVMDVAGKRVLAYNMAGTDFEIVTRKNQVFTKKTDNPILLAKLASNGSSAVVTQTEKYSAYLTVYDSNGSEIYTWASGRRITDIVFDDDGKGCVISTIASSDGSIQSVIYHVAFDQQDAVMQSEEIDTIAISACVTEKNQYWVVGDDKFVKLDEQGKKLTEYEYSDELVSFALSNSYASVLTKSVEKNHGNLITFDSDSETNDPSATIVTDGNPKKLKLVNGTSVLLNDKTALSYDINGNLLATAQVSSDYIGFTYFGGSVYFLGYHEINKIAFDT